MAKNHRSSDNNTLFVFRPGASSEPVDSPPQRTYLTGMTKQDNLEILRELHPNYTDEELQESYLQLTDYFESVWKMFCRIEAEGKMDNLINGLKRDKKSRNGL
jgi:hypothetical protein